MAYKEARYRMSSLRRRTSFTERLKRDPFAARRNG
jgi:hypothetical protein